MNCNDIAQALSNGTLPSEAEDHLKSCEHCRQFVEAFNVPASEDMPSSAVLRRIETGLLSDLRPVRPIAPKRFFFAVFIAIFIFVVTIGISRIGAFAFAAMSPIQAGGILGTLAISTVLLAYSLVNQMVPRTHHRIPPWLLLLGIVVGLATAMAVLFEFQHEPNLWRKNWVCIRAGTAIAALAALPLWLVLRRGAILSASAAGAGTGLLAGLAGTTALEIHCPNLDASHILVAHLGVAALGSMIGLVLGWSVENGGIMSRRP